MPRRCRYPTVADSAAVRCSGKRSANRFPGEDQPRLLAEYLRQKYAGTKIDVAMATSGPALTFLLKYRERLFPEAPIVFTTWKEYPTNEDRTSGPGLTGVVVDDSNRNNLALALTLHAGTRQVFVISGSPERDGKLEALARADLSEFEGKVQLTYLTDLPLNDLIDQVRDAPEHSVVLYIRQSQDVPGYNLTPDDVVTLLAQSSSVPIYGVVSSQLGRGIIGGYLYNTEALATQAGELALRIAKGARPQDIPVTRAATIPTFDWRQLVRWGISERSL